mmetsp:Transcript_46374/g.100730  ORF Transcript_46374/g.100730 Transcript_46374/m.100730 type:complete len:89 (-) Transcript_46374:672-938(-)
MSFSEDLVVPKPEVRAVPLAVGDECVILGSDGLWDAVTYQEALKMVAKYREEHDEVDGAAKLLVDTAVARMVPDNVTCIVIALAVQPE